MSNAVTSVTEVTRNQPPSISNASLHVLTYRGRIYREKEVARRGACSWGAVTGYVRYVGSAGHSTRSQKFPPRQDHSLTLQTTSEESIRCQESPSSHASTLATQRNTAPGPAETPHAATSRRRSFTIFAMPLLTQRKRFHNWPSYVPSSGEESSYYSSTDNRLHYELGDMKCRQ